MLNSQIIKIETPKKFLLNGLLLGPKKAKTFYIFIHGLGGSLFSQLELAQKLVNKDTAVISFNNRGFGTINRVARLDKRRLKGYINLNMGMAHEVFGDCLDDIDGAVNYASKLGAKRIILLGHSTGCQKSVYYLSKKKKSKVSAAILLAPLSDLADMRRILGEKEYKKLISLAKKMFKAGRSSELMPFDKWPIPMDAQRFLSLYSPGSEEDIFSYFTKKDPKALKKLSTPLLIVLAGADEYADRGAKEIATWFNDVIKAKKQQVVKIIPGASHNFFQQRQALSTIIKKWTKDI